MASFKEKIEANKGRHAYVEGCYAAQDGKSKNSNPYSANSIEAIEWLDGYLDAQYLGGM
jgi:ribosome modulation factor